MGRKINRYKLIFAGLITIFILGCQTGSKHYESAMQLNEAGNYSNAIAYLEEAIKLEPNNQKYIAALADIKNSRVNIHLSKAMTLLDSLPLTINSLSEAKNSISKAREIDSENNKVKNISERYSKLEASFYKEIKEEYQTIKQNMTSNEWDSAYFNLQQLQSRFPSYEDTFQLMSITIDKGAEYFYKIAKDSLVKDNLSKAIENANKAIALNMDYAPAREILDLARERDNLKYFVRKGAKAASIKNWDAAISYYKRAREYEPDNKELEQLVDQVYVLASKYYIQKAGQNIDHGYLLRGLESYEKAVEYAPSKDNYSLQSFRQRFSQLAGNAANMFQNQGNFGSAWYWYKKIENMNKNYPDIFYSIQKMEDEINARIKKAIAVFDFGSPSDYKDAGVIVANNLITYLFNSASKDIKILERENLKSILEEMKLGQVGVVNPDSAQEMGKVYGINVAIMGSVLLYNVESYQTTGKKTVRYKTGTKIIDNIDYLNWQAKNPVPSKEQIATAPPAKIIEDVFTQKDYEVSQHKKNGFVQLSFRIVDVATGENIKVDTIEVKKEIVDEGSAGLAEANIKYDPLEITTDIDLLQDLTNTAVSELGREALKPLQYMEKIYFDTGENFLKRRNTIDAIENYINAIFDEKMKMISGSPITAESNSKIHDIFYNFQISEG
ncbi:CsgG/HfaB family protein [Desulfobacula toluolica]|uniref:Tetratricopeptide repeat domain protein n=1 Tax=Desulfobacula toluolica (strain DSM 7467 / Tol2) TaxID=651182 RepID=K0NJP4_DESTT|nr:CsgG/HfaB family protein [Desulfobacula toluolica]CCK81060.1 tetratricopeptide repeat domain protein [Desulfobacula toluolica Tol2]